nr:BMP family ABC transporter substrate-binding protein [Acanthopleuribacter pedis]
MAFQEYQLGDKGFNDMQYTAMAKAQVEEGFRLELFTPDNETPSERVLEKCIAADCKIILTTEGYSVKEPVERLAAVHPDRRFILMDEKVVEGLPNLTSRYFITAEAAYLAGIIAADLSQSGVLGIVGGKQENTVLDFVVGFEQGAKATRPDIVIEKRWVDAADPTTLPWFNPVTAANLTQALAEEHRADIVFAVAGGSNLGVFNKCKELGIKAIGCDTDQDHLAKGVILTSVIKKLDTVLEQTVKQCVNGRFLAGAHGAGLAQDGVSLSPMRYTYEQIPAETHAKVAAAKAAIIAGEISVTSAWRQAAAKAVDE